MQFLMIFLSIIRNKANKNDGTAYPTTMIPLVQTSNVDPSLTAFTTPKGMEIRYTRRVVHNPKESETGNFSPIREITLWSRK